jgi:hypothetical protein
MEEILLPPLRAFRRIASQLAYAPAVNYLTREKDLALWKIRGNEELETWETI